jgi:hypothetical protein
MTTHKGHSHAEPEAKVSHVAPSEPMPATGCIVCGQYTGTFVDVTANARIHEACAAARPDIVRKAKARG